MRAWQWQCPVSDTKDPRCVGDGWCSHPRDGRAATQEHCLARRQTPEEPSVSLKVLDSSVPKKKNCTIALNPEMDASETLIKIKTKANKEHSPQKPQA